MMCIYKRYISSFYFNVLNKLYIYVEAFGETNKKLKLLILRINIR